MAEKFKALLDRIPEGWFKSIDVGEGWDDLVIELDSKLSLTDPQYKLHQCKEKFGELRYYTGGLSDEGRLIVLEYEAKSRRTCDHCGNPGATAIRQRWYRTVCAPFAEENGYSFIDDEEKN